MVLFPFQEKEINWAPNDILTKIEKKLVKIYFYITPYTQRKNYATYSWKSIFR